MNLYLCLKLVHIISSVILAGVGFGSAYYLFFINRTGNAEAIAQVIKLVVRADFWFTTPAIIIQPITGLAMSYLAGFSMHQSWLFLSLLLYLIAGVCWLPVVWIQIQMAKLAEVAIEEQQPLPLRYWQVTKYWEYLGYPAFIAVILIYGLMVFKPIF